MRKCLTDIGVTIKNLPEGWANKTGRDKEWKKQRKVYGFDERETWELDHVFKTLIYERLCMYNYWCGIDTTYHKFEYNGEILTFQDCLDKMIEGFKIGITEESDEDYDYKREKINQAYDILALCHESLWW